MKSATLAMFIKNNLLKETECGESDLKEKHIQAKSYA